VGKTQLEFSINSKINDVIEPIGELAQDDNGKNGQSGSD